MKLFSLPSAFVHTGKKKGRYKHTHTRELLEAVQCQSLLSYNMESTIITAQMLH